MLAKTMTDQLMREYNYGGRGQKGKKAFKDLPALPRVMIGKFIYIQKKIK
jgi:hypothetical protein